MASSLINKLKTIENKLRRDANMSGQIDYNEQIAWMLFLKALDVLDEKQAEEAAFKSLIYDPILHPPFRWSSFINEDRTAEKKMEFIRDGLIPHLRSLFGTSQRELVAQVFTDIPTKLPKSPYTLAEVLDLIDSIDLNNIEDTHIVSQFYEESLLKMGSQGRQAGGEFYTPRPIIRLILRMLNPKIGDLILDPFMGSAGFLAEGFLFLKNKENLTAREYEKLQYETFIGQELKPIPFLLGVMNCILHGLYGAKFSHKNTFSDNIRSLDPQSRVDLIITNPPFGAEVEPTLLENYPYPTSSSQVLAVQYILRRLKPGGRCGMVVDEGFLSRISEKSYENTKKELINENNIYAVVSLPNGVFKGVGAGVKTSLIFFERGKPTKDIWYYKLTKKFTKARPIKDVDLEDCFRKFENNEVSVNSWVLPVQTLRDNQYDLSANNIVSSEILVEYNPSTLIKNLNKENLEYFKTLQKIKDSYKTKAFNVQSVGFIELDRISSIIKGKSPTQKTEPGEYPLVVTAEERKSSTTFQFDQEAVCVPLVSSTGHGHADIKRIHYQRGKFALANIMVAITSNDENKILTKYLYYYLSSVKDSVLISLMRGSANVTIPIEKLKRLKVPIPPINVQKNIVKKLDLIEQGSISARSQEKVLRDLYKMCLHQEFSDTLNQNL